MPSCQASSRSSTIATTDGSLAIITWEAPISKHSSGRAGSQQLARATIPSRLLNRDAQGTGNGSCKSSANSASPGTGQIFNAGRNGSQKLSIGARNGLHTVITCRTRPGWRKASQRQNRPPMLSPTRLTGPCASASSSRRASTPRIRRGVGPQSVPRSQP